ncbi:MAG: heavy-metal-associated domain-containing protein, partial [Flavobacteriales bacterium]|nr:heavy-metal-associated domain-containing protein [Flavobacteriales bacterium]
MGDDESEVFLSLEDDGPPLASTKPGVSGRDLQPQTTMGTGEGTPNTTVLEAELVDVAVMEQAGGAYEVMWPLTAMDCPDCASKATRALNHMKQVSEPKVSPTSGEIKVKVDLEFGSMAEISAVLRSLGHPPNVEHHELVGAKASEVAKRTGVPIQKLERVVKQQPGVLDAEV